LRFRLTFVVVLFDDRCGFVQRPSTFVRPTSINIHSSGFVRPAPFVHQRLYTDVHPSTFIHRHSFVVIHPHRCIVFFKTYVVLEHYN
jgi:hypothetical protein